MLSQALITKSTWSKITRAGADVKGSTKFKLKKKKGKGESKVDHAKERSKVMDMFERYGKILAHKRPVKPPRTEEEQQEAKEMVLMRNRKLQERLFIANRRETMYFRMKELAFEELPTESLKAAALVPDKTPLPKDFVTICIEPPIEDEEVFGKPMTGVTQDEDLLPL